MPPMVTDAGARAPSTCGRDAPIDRTVREPLPACGPQAWPCARSAAATTPELGRDRTLPQLRRLRTGGLQLGTHILQP